MVARLLLPFTARGTGSYYSHRFVLTTEEEPTVVVDRYFATSAPFNLFPYDPYHVEGDPEQSEKNLEVLTEEELLKYRSWKKTIAFSEEYAKVTGRAYLSAYPRPRPVHFMWPAEYFGQTHWATTRETHFQTLPPAEQLEKISVHGTPRRLQPSQPRLLSEYRVPEPVMNMTLKVLSCAPRVYEIADFLSPLEVRHILQLAGQEDLKKSTTGDPKVKQEFSKTRTSKNSWIERERSPIVDAIYRRAADVMRIDEALLRHRVDGERPDFPAHQSLAELLQLVHYDVGQEYTAHHDFAYPPLDDTYQQSRFATLLLYLNEGMEGGETTFPRWSNAETFEQLKVVPKIGKAVLFYSILPDGNMDDLSQHEARKLRLGEKWLINLWVW